MIDAELTVDSLHATGESLVWHVAEQALFVLVLVTDRAWNFSLAAARAGRLST